MFSATDASTSPRPNASPQTAAAIAPRRAGRQEMTEAERRKLEELKATDARVRRHEEAHRAAAGALYRGGPNYTYETGPDGKRYAIAGSVQIDTSPGRTPEETVQKASAIRRAALAPNDPSGTDRAVAAKATRMEDAARRALAKQSISTPEPASKPAQPEQAPEDGAESATPQADQTLSPGDLGGEVWSVVSDLAQSESLRQDRRADQTPPASPSLDVLA